MKDLLKVWIVVQTRVVREERVQVRVRVRVRVQVWSRQPAQAVVAEEIGCLLVELNQTVLETATTQALSSEG